MTRFFALTILCAALALPASAQQADFSDLQGLDAAQVGNMVVPNIQLPDTGWGVTYALKGIVSLTEQGPYLNTVDCRIFKLQMSEEKARRFDGKSVLLEAKARQADDLSLLKVETIAEYRPRADEVVPAPYKPRQRQAQMLENRNGVIRMGNVRTMRGDAPAKDSYDWTDMTMRPELIKNVYFVKKPFYPEVVAAHSLLVFTFEKGGLKDAEGKEQTSLALSIEARLREDQQYSALMGFGKNAGIIWSLSTWEEYAAREVDGGKYKLYPYPVNLDGAQKAELLRQAMAQASVDREGEYYHTTRNNCTNNLIILFNKVLPGEQQVPLWNIPYNIYNYKATMPLEVIANLQQQGILGSELADVNIKNLKTPLR